MAVLTEIVLTEDKGFVEKETGNPVTIYGGRADLSKNVQAEISDETLRDEISDEVVRVFGPLSDINGYVLHSTVPINQDNRVVQPFTALMWRYR